MGTPLIIGTLHPGFSRDHMMVFRRERDVRITQTAAETNRLIIRVERVKGGGDGTQDGVRIVFSVQMFRVLQDPPRTSKARKGIHHAHTLVITSL